MYIHARLERLTVAVSGQLLERAERERERETERDEWRLFFCRARQTARYSLQSSISRTGGGNQIHSCMHRERDNMHDVDS